MRAVAFLFLLCAASSASAQTRVYDVTYRPAGSTFLVVQTPNFEVIYEAGYEREAAELAWQLERYLPTAADMIGHRGWMRMPVILRGYDDTANGFVSVRPFRQEIDAAGIKGPVITSQFGSWIEAVAPHELVHALHADTRHGGGIGSIIRPFAPDHARSINLGNPSGVSEGIAVRFESSIRDGAGRMSHPHFVMKFRAAMAEGRWSLARMLEPSHVSLPFDRHYVGGAFYIDHLADDGDVEAFRRARRAFYRFPFLGYGVSMWWGNREAPFRTGAAIRERWARTEQERLLTNGPFDEPTRIISEVGMMIQSPRWLSADELVVHARGYSTRAGFYRVDAESGWMRLIAHEGLSGEGTFHLDSSRGQIIFSRYDADVLPTDAARAGLPGLPGRTRRLLAVYRLIDLREARQLRQRRVADDVARIVQRAEGEQRHHGAVLDQRHDVLQVGRRRLVVDRGLAAHGRHAAVGTALEAHDHLDVEAQHVNEELFANWLEKQLAQARAALQSGDFQSARTYVEECRIALRLPARASRLMNVFHQSIEMLDEAVEHAYQMRYGGVQQEMIQQRLASQWRETTIRRHEQLRERPGQFYGPRRSSHE